MASVSSDLGDRMRRDSSVLAEIALRLARSPEDVATECVAYILERSEASRTLLLRLTQDWTQRTSRPIATVRSQAGADDNSRPDIELQDDAGSPVILFENKFWAGLTDAQPNEYLKRIESAGGTVWFVAPAARLPFLWPDLLQRIEASGGRLEALLNSQEVKTARLDDCRFLVLTSWSFLLGQVHTALESDGDLQLVADLRQLEGLASRMESEGFLPITASDLSGPAARLTMQCCSVVDGAIKMLLREPWASKKGLKASAGAGWYGHYVKLHGHGCLLCFHAPTWKTHGASPLWLRIADSEWKYPDKAEHALVGRFGRDRCIPIEKGLWLHIALPVGLEYEPTVNSVADQVRDVAGALVGLLDDSVVVTLPPDEELS